MSTPIGKKEPVHLQQEFDPTQSSDYFYLFVLVCAVGLAVYLRFTGLGIWPLALDEYFLYQSAANWIEHGLPRFDHGGYYGRSLLYQLLLVPTLLLGVESELATRFWAALFGLAAIAGGYKTALQLGSWRSAVVVVVLLSLSLWEVEMSRFGRMYTFFQAFAVWYAYFACRLVHSGARRYWVALSLLSVLAPLVWEGGIFLSIFNFVVFLFLRQRQPWLFLALIAIFFSTLVFSNVDFRYLGSTPTDATENAPATRVSAEGTVAIKHSEDATSAGQAAGSGQALPIDTTHFKILNLSIDYSSLWGAVYIALVVAFFAYLAWQKWRKTTLLPNLLWTLLLGLLLIFNQYLLAGLLIAGLLLLQWVSLEGFRQQRPWLLAGWLAALSLFWLLALYGPLRDEAAGELLRSPLSSLIGFPNLVTRVIWPLQEVAQWWFVLLGLGFAGLFVALVLRLPSTADQPLRKERQLEERAALRLLSLLVLVGLSGVAALDTLYLETRYFFFVYPLLLAVVVCSLGHYICDAKVLALSHLLLLAAFSLGEDFSFEHLRAVKSYAANFRIGYSEQLSRHLYPRFDVRSAVRQTKELSRPEDIVVTDSVLFAHYAEDADFYYLHQDDERYAIQIYNYGRSERWSGLPFFGKATQQEFLRSSVDSTAQFFFVSRMDGTRAKQLYDQVFRDFDLREIATSRDGQFLIYSQRR